MSVERLVTYIMVSLLNGGFGMVESAGLLDCGSRDPDGMRDLALTSMRATATDHHRIGTIRVHISNDGKIPIVQT